MPSGGDPPKRVPHPEAKVFADRLKAWRNELKAIHGSRYDQKPCAARAGISWPRWRKWEDGYTHLGYRHAQIIARGLEVSKFAVILRLELNADEPTEERRRQIRSLAAFADDKSDETYLRLVDGIEQDRDILDDDAAEREN